MHPVDANLHLEQAGFVTGELNVVGGQSARPLTIRPAATAHRPRSRLKHRRAITPIVTSS